MIFYTCSTHAYYTPGVEYELIETPKGSQLVTKNAKGQRLTVIELKPEEVETLNIEVIKHDHTS